MSDFKCPVCGNIEDDERHVAVECFYDVKEIVPDAEEVLIFHEVPEEGSYWGITRRYGPGTRDEHRTIPEGKNACRVETEQVPIDKIRLVENHMFSVTCCKPCRAKFLEMFGKWRRNELPDEDQREPSEDRNVPIRKNGALVYISEEEFYAMRRKRDAADQGSGS